MAATHLWCYHMSDLFSSICKCWPSGCLSLMAFPCTSLCLFWRGFNLNTYRARLGTLRLATLQCFLKWLWCSWVDGEF